MRLRTLKNHMFSLLQIFSLKQIQLGYMGNTWPPFYNDVQKGLDAAHNMIITQARVWHAYDQDYR